jgi:septum formation topological specificity factor MinE
MFERGGAKEADRLKKVLLNGKGNTEQLMRALKSDITAMLKNYLEIENSDVRLALDLDDGKYILKIKAETRKIIGLL